MQERPDPPLGAGRGAHRRGRGGHQLRRRDGAHRALPGRAEAAVRRRLRGRRHDPRARRGRRGPRRPASACSRARSSAATPRRSSSRRATSSPLPDGCSFEQGAAIPVNYAHRVGRADRLRQPAAAASACSMHAAGGGVGIAATQIAKRDGAEVYGTASPGKHERIRELGVDHALDYTQRRLGARAAAVRRDPRRDRRQELPHAATTCCAPAGGWSPSAPPRVVIGREAQPRSRRCARSLRMPRFNLIKQMSESKAVIGLNMLHAVEGPRHARAVDRAAARDARRRHGRAGRRRRRSASSDAGDAQPHDHRAPQRRQGRARPLRRLASARPVLPCRRRCRCQVSPLSLLLLPPRGE